MIPLFVFVVLVLAVSDEVAQDSQDRTRSGNHARICVFREGKRRRLRCWAHRRKCTLLRRVQNVFVCHLRRWRRRPDRLWSDCVLVCVLVSEGHRGARCRRQDRCCNEGVSERQQAPLFLSHLALKDRRLSLPRRRMRLRRTCSKLLADEGLHACRATVGTCVDPIERECWTSARRKLSRSECCGCGRFRLERWRQPHW